MRITANGISIHYTLNGPASAPVVTLSHSLATSLAMWEPQAAATGAVAMIRSRYEIACPFFAISLRLLMPFPEFLRSSFSLTTG